jgi:FkbM family methyltransferase
MINLSYIKKVFRKALLFYGWKLIKFRKPHKPRLYKKKDLELLNCMNNASGILHLGAHRGSEAEIYNWFQKKVIWFEAMPDIFERLKENLYFYNDQKSFCTLLGDTDNVTRDFYISNHDSTGSSLFDFSKKVKDKVYWGTENYTMEKKISLKMFKIDTILKENKISALNYDHWVIDLQGSELLALKGAEESLKFCKSIYIEISKLNYYEGGVLWDDLSSWLKKKGYYSTKMPTEDHMDVLFKRN